MSDNDTSGGVARPWAARKRYLLAPSLAAARAPGAATAAAPTRAEQGSADKEITTSAGDHAALGRAAAAGWRGWLNRQPQPAVAGQRAAA